MDGPTTDPRTSAYIDEVDALRFADIGADAAGPPLHEGQRQRVRVLAWRARELRAEDVARLDRFRLGQYLRIGFVDPARFFAALDAGDLVTATNPDDIWVFAIDEAGRMLCSVVLRALTPLPLSVRMRDADRPLFPVEQVHGHGVFNRLSVLPDLPVRRVRELAGFVKNQRLEQLSEAAIRGPVEVGVTAFRLLSGPLAFDVGALIGDLEESVAKVSLDFLGGRPVLVRGTIPYLPGSAFLAPRYEERTVHPFALLCSDSEESLARLTAVEKALELPGPACLLALLELKRETIAGAWSTFSTVHGDRGPDAAASLRGVDMDGRRELLDLAAQLNRYPLFASLSAGEVNPVVASMQRMEFAAGSRVIRSGDPGDALYLVESGRAVAWLPGAGRQVGEFGPGDHFGEIAVLLAGRRTADVVAATDLHVWRLSSEAYHRLLGHATVVERLLSRSAMSRVVNRPTAATVMS